MSRDDACSYDELPYEDSAYYHTHPSNLAVVATLCGLNPPPVANCRVLELGCGTGFNLLAMAHSLPQARFVGVDLSARQIAMGRDRAAALQIDRLDLHARDVAGIDASFGQFDYIIAHGLFSWIPDTARAAILDLCKRHLTPKGIAYISYNTYPGWHIRGILRDMLRFHAPAEAPPLERVRQARAALERLLGTLPDPDTPYSQLLRAEVEALRRDGDVYVVHEFLEPHNQPLHFEEFAQLATAHGLRFLAEARFGTNTFAQQPEMQQVLAAVSADLVRREQHHDFLRNRSFRQSLLCHAEVLPPWSPSLPALGPLRVYRRVESLGRTPGAGEAERFHLDGQRVVVTADRILRGLLHGLHEAWPRMISVADLATRVFDRLGPDGFVPGASPGLQVALRILRGYADGLWHLFAYDPPYASAAGECPRGCPLARQMAEQGCEVTNRLHRPVRLTEEERMLLRRLDGQTPRTQLASELGVSGESLEKSLRLLAESALLVG